MSPTSPGAGRAMAALVLVVLLGGGIGIGIAADRLWLRPNANVRVKETMCRARGDAHCEYHCTWRI